MSVSMTWKSYAAVSGAGLLATYLFSTPPLGPPDQSGAARRPAPPRPGVEAFDIGAEASRLREGLPPAADFDEPSRNPFRFGARQGRSAPQLAAEAAVAPAPTLPPPAAAPPSVRLSGIATTTVDGQRQRVAVLITPAGVQYAREGDAVGADYRVTRIDEDGVDLQGAEGTSLRLLLRP